MKGKDKYWLKSGLLSILQSFSGLIFGFGGFYILVRQLSKDEFGAWSLFSTTVMILEFIRNGLIQNALIKFLAANKDDYNKIISSSYTISGVLTVVCILINLLFANYLAEKWQSPQLAVMFHLYNIAYIFTGALSQFQFIEQANFKFDGIFLSTFCRQGIFFGYILVCFLLKVNVNVETLVYVQIVSIFVSMVVAWFYVRKHLKFTYIFDMVWIKKMFGYGKYAFGTTIGSMLSGSIDQMMLGALMSPAAAGAYNIAIRITNIVEIPTSSVATIVFPQSAKRMEEEGEAAVKRLYEKSVGTILAILLPGLLFLFLFSGFVVDFVAGTQYPETIPILQITIVYCLLIPYGRQCGIVFDSIGKPKVTFILVIISAVINAALNFFFIKHYAAVGAAVATLISQIIGFAIAQVIIYRMLNIKIMNTLVYMVQFYPEFYVKYVKPALFKNKNAVVAEGEREE